MKIVYYTQTPFLDSDFPLIQSFQQRGYEVLVFVTLPPHALRGTLLDIKKQIQCNDVIPAKEYAEMKIYSDYIDLSHFYFLNRTNSSVRTFDYIRIVKKMCNMIEEFNPDVIHSTIVPDTVELLLYKFRHKMVVTMHDPFLHSGKSNLRSIIHRYIAVKLIPKIVLLNSIQKDIFVKKYKINENKILVNRLGSYTFLKQCFLPKCKRSDKTVNLLFFGHIASYKGLEFLMQAMPIIKRDIPNIKLTIAGGGEIYFDYKPYKSCDYIKVINRYVSMEELATLLECCSVVVCPYKDATQSGVVMSAFAMNRTVVATNVGGLAEQIRNGVTGVIVRPGDVQELADAIIRICKDQSLICKFESNIEEQNSSYDYSWSFIASKYVDFYTKDI